MSNVPILYENCLLQYTTEIAKKAWLWFAENRDRSAMKYPSDLYAKEVEILTLQLQPMLKASQSAHDCSGEVMSDLLKFILKRHANYRLGGNVKLWWE